MTDLKVIEGGAADKLELLGTQDGEPFDKLDLNSLLQERETLLDRLVQVQLDIKEKQPRQKSPASPTPRPPLRRV